jgi:hypothetical protein
MVQTKPAYVLLQTASQWLSVKRMQKDQKRLSQLEPHGGLRFILDIRLREHNATARAKGCNARIPNVSHAQAMHNNMEPAEVFKDLPIYGQEL